MATPATPQPTPDQGATPQAGGAAPGPGGGQANPLQQALAKLAQICDQMSQQNPVVQGELQEAKSAFVKALQKTMMAALPEAGGAPGGGAPPPQGA